MTEAEIAACLDATAGGASLLRLAEQLFPIPRSLTGDGVRATLRVLGGLVPLEVREVPSGTAVLDWTVPDEWNVREAWIETPSGRRIADWAVSALHLVGYSEPVDGRFSLAELRPHLHTRPDRPDDVPYRTTYWRRGWGFCLAAREADRLEDGDYRVRIDSTLRPGALSYAECVIPGRRPDTVLLSAHVCHPNLANDNLSGIAVATFVARALTGRRNEFTYRVLFAPAVIGAIAWLAANRDAARLIRHGLVLSCLGDGGPLVYKRSRRESAPIDRAVSHVLQHLEPGATTRPFDPYGYDERQFCSPGFDLPVGRLTRTPNGEYPEYHTSADDLALLRSDALQRSYEAVLRTIQVIEGDETLRNTAPFGEPQLGRRGLYGGLGGGTRLPEEDLALLWVLNQADGRHSLLDIAERSRLPFSVVRSAADALRRTDLLTPVRPSDQESS